MSFGILYFKLHNYNYSSVFTSILTIVFNITKNLYHYCIYVQTFFWSMQQMFVFSYNFPCLFVNGTIFFFSKFLIFNEHSFNDSQNFFTQFTSVHIMLIFYNIKFPYCRHSVSTGNMLNFLTTLFSHDLL